LPLGKRLIVWATFPPLRVFFERFRVNFDTSKKLSKAERKSVDASKRSDSLMTFYKNAQPLREVLLKSIKCLK